MQINFKNGMKQIVVQSFFLFSFVFPIFGQIEPVDVAQLTLKVGIGKTEELYYGFAEGDQIVFSFEEVKGKPIKEIEVAELPTNSKFTDYKTSSIVDQKVKANKKAVYSFTFRNSALAARICKIKIQRIPKTEDLISFNTDWKWRTLYDTTYVPYTEDSIVGYDTTHYLITKQRLIRDELILKDVLSNHAIKVHSRYYNYSVFENNVGQYNEEIVDITLPKTTNTKYHKVENVAWYYGIGINQRLKKEANKTKSDILNTAGTVASILGMPEMKVAFKLINIVTTDDSDLAIETGLFGDYDNAKLFLYDNSNSRALRWDNIVSSSSIRMDKPLKGKVYLGLENENGTSALAGGTKAVTVYVNVSVWTRTRVYEDYQEEKQKITARKTTLHKKRMVVKTSKIRVNASN
jgi:hypothetical protein